MYIQSISNFISWKHSIKPLLKYLISLIPWRKSQSKKTSLDNPLGISYKKIEDDVIEVTIMGKTKRVKVVKEKR